MTDRELIEALAQEVKELKKDLDFLYKKIQRDKDEIYEIDKMKADLQRQEMMQKFRIPWSLRDKPDK